jgi:lipopolysaccharide/colanic/teichoic acid biosynthesis glycosyltransferase
LVALLFPDTDEQGIETFMRKIKPRIERFGASKISGTYPAQLFAQLLAEPRDLSRLPWFVVSNLKHQNENGYRLKRTLDIAGAIAGILLLSPLMLITAIAVALDSRGPILFRQMRVGRGGVPFVFYKFRSMHPEFVKKLIPGKLEEVNQGDADNPCYKTKSHPSVTRVGSFIRATSIDEFPQLFNVLKGDMSLVGPQPLLPHEIENYESWHLMQILELKPGITGPWRVEGHSSTTFNDMVRFDLRHIPSCSLILDLRILLKTVKMLLRWI